MTYQEDLIAEPSIEKDSDELTESELINLFRDNNLTFDSIPASALAVNSTNRTLSIDDTFTGTRRDIVTVPILINDATGLQSLDITLQYDTNLLTIVDPNSATDNNEGVKKAGIAENWKIINGEGTNSTQEQPNPVANVDPETGIVKISLVNPGEPPTTGSGKIIEIDFQVNCGVAFGSKAAIDLQVAKFGINGQEIIVGDSNLDDGSLTVIRHNNAKAVFVNKNDFLKNPSQYMKYIRDFDGNDLGTPNSWKQIGSIDVQDDGDIEYVFVNPVIGRWATVGADISGTIDFADYNWCGDTRVVGIYEDPLIALGLVVKGSDVDSQRRFQNDLYIDNLTLIANSDFDYDGNGLQEIYFKVNDGTAVLHAYMHADGNIQYANYQSQSDLQKFMNDNGIDSSIWNNWF
ncbi:hypothetical protein STA3757_07190 [Stanieria sp. NIES-3757]|nr:hypothetical protein STA3757_07190 [Stanieria sp. NIES-3757]